MSDEIRSVSSTGGEKGVKAQRHDLLPRQALDAISEVYAFGAEKYADHNWRRGYEWGKSYSALQRHVTAFWDGESNDPESGLSHLAHAGFHIFALLTWLQQQGEGVQNPFDDRWPHALERARLAEEIPCDDAGQPLWDSIEAYHAYLLAEEERRRERGRKIAAIQADLANIEPDEEAQERGLVQHVQFATTTNGEEPRLAKRWVKDYDGETDKFAPFDPVDISAFQAKIDEICGGSIYGLAKSAEISWKEPEPHTLGNMRELQDRINETLAQSLAEERAKATGFNLPRWYVNENLNPKG